MKAALAAAVMTVFMSGAALADGGLEMSTSYTGVSVKPGDTVSFSLDFDNSGSSENVSLSASELPDGFEGYFQGGGNTVNGVYVKNGENDSLASYKVTVPDNAEEGSYPLTLQASGEYNSDALTLTVNVTNLDLGSSKLTTDYEEQQAPAAPASPLIPPFRTTRRRSRATACQPRRRTAGPCASHRPDRALRCLQWMRTARAPRDSR